MSFNDAANYVLFTNPLSKGLIYGLSSATKIPSMLKNSSKPAPVVKAPTMDIPLHKIAGNSSIFIRLAGLSGASAIALGAYGAHRKYPPPIDDSIEKRKIDLKNIFETANRMHILHSLALLGVPLTRKPFVTGTLMSIGTLVFCFPCYYRAFTGETQFNKATPFGGFILIIAWLSMIF